MDVHVKKTIIDIVRPWPRDSHYAMKLKLFHVFDMYLKII